MASGELSLTSNSSQEGSHEFNYFPNDRPQKPSADSPKDFESAKQQYDQAIIELNSLRLQHSDSKRRMDHIMEQLEFYREQYMAAMNQVEQSAQEGSNLRTKYTDISNENVRLKKKLLKQEKESGNSQTVCAFVEQYNELKKKYDTSRVECEKISKDCSDLSRDRNSLALEKDDLKQQLANAFAQLEAAIRDKNIYREARDKLIQQHDEDIKEMNQVMQSRAEELRRVTTQRNAAELELRTILAERKGVLEENQKLSDDLTAAKEELEKHYKEDKKLTYENENLKREIESLLRYKDDLMKECNSLRDEVNNRVDNMDILKSRDSGWSKDLSDSKDKFGLNEQHILDLETANQEIDKLKKSLERAKSEIKKAVQETDVAKSRRDWAISEREKIVQERDSVKILCDELRKERDTAISDLLAAIRDSEKIKKQKDEACKEVEQIREQMETQLSSSRRNVRWSYNPYDLDLLQKNDTELIEIDVQGTITERELGIILEGGREDSQNRIDCGIVVVSVATDSIAYGKLKPGDCILQVNSLDCASVSKRMVIETIKASVSRCAIVVRRLKINKSHMYAVQLNMSGNRNHGLTLETGVFIAKIAPSSLAAKEENLMAGDRVLSVNSKTMEGVTSAKDAMSYLDDNRTDSVTIIALKQVTQATEFIGSRTKHKMINQCTQTDDRYTAEAEQGRNFASSNSKSTSKISEMINKFKGKMHIHGHSNQKGSTVSESDSLCQENDAIAVLDSVLNNENSAGKAKDLFKRSKRSKKDSGTQKDANKNLGTWPRANILNATHDSTHSGTIVQHRKKERPALSLFTGPITLGIGKDEKPSTSKKDNYFTPLQIPPKPLIASAGASNSNRNSNPIPFHVLYPPPPSVLNRHSVYAIEQEPVLLENSKSVPISSGTNTIARNQQTGHKQQHHHHHHHYHNVGLNANRLSLNLTPTSENINLFTPVVPLSTTMTRKSPITNSDTKMPSLMQPQQHQQNSLDYIPLKNSIDSFLGPKSPLSSLDFKRNSMQTPPQFHDLISLKSQNSIDSFLAPTKSPPSTEFQMIKSMMMPKDSIDLYGPKRGSRTNYASDSDSLGMESIATTSNSYTSTLPSYSANSRAQAIPTAASRNQRLFPSSFGGHLHHPHSYHLRQTSPLTLPMTQSSIESGSLHSTDKLEFDYAPPMHAHIASMDVDPYSRNKGLPIRERGGDMAYGSSYGHAYEGGTFPRKKENQRFRIPSNPSVTSKGSGVKNSTGSIEHGSERGSPMPPALFQVEVLSHGINKRNSMPDYCYGQKPSPGDLRRVTIDKSVEPLGITIRCNNNGGGIFVSTVTENSIASQVGLQVGDQLLEVCGINMRAATYDLAANVLRQCGNSITMLVQYSPDKYDGNIVQHTSEDESVSRSGSPTPRNSPRSTRSILMPPPQSSSSTSSTKQQTAAATVAPQRSSILPSQQMMGKKQKFADSLENQSDCGDGGAGGNSGQLNSTKIYENEPRIITMNTKKNTNLGISLLGGNAVGIYVHDVQKNSLADSAGMRKGDQILEYNGADLRSVTAEQAANEISRPADKVTVVVQLNLEKFNQIKDEAGDSLYIRVGFDRTGDLGEGELRFVKEDVLYVDTTIFRGVFGQWRAWKLDEYGHRLECGIIPSQLKVEEELRLLGDITDGDGTTRRGSTSARRSFFRRKKHQRSSSRDSKELASFSNTQLSWFSDSGMLSEEGTILSYQRVERLDYNVCRPVLILGPLSELVADKMSTDFPQLFQRCIMTSMNCSADAMEKGLQNNIFVDYRKRGSIYECTTVQAIRDICDKNRHCILDVCISAVERLQQLQIYPIVLLLRFKSAKQIKEIKDSRYSTDRISAKAAKEMYEHAMKLESDYRQYISAVIPAGVNITHMSTQIKAAVDEEQTKVLWVPVTTIIN